MLGKASASTTAVTAAPATGPSTTRNRGAHGEGRLRELGVERRASCPTGGRIWGATVTVLGTSTGSERAFSGAADTMGTGSGREVAGSARSRPRARREGTDGMRGASPTASRYFGRWAEPKACYAG